MKGPAKVHFILFSINFIYALSFVLVKDITPSAIHPLALQVLRGAAGFLFFTTLVFFSSDKEKVPLKDMFLIALCGIFGIALNGIFFLKGIALTQPINASLIIILAPILVTIIAYFAFREKVGYKRALGLFLGLVGAYIIITKLKMPDLGQSTFQGDLFIFANAFSFSIYLILARKMLKKYSPLTMARWLFTFGFLFVIPFGAKYLPEVNVTTVTTNQWLILAYMLIFPTCLNFYFYNVALKQVPPTVASSYIFFQPVLTAAIALLLGRDSLDIYKIVGGILIFVGVYVVTFTKKKAT